MIYKHEHFTLNTGDKTVLNKHNEPVNLTGHAYVLLELLCIKHPEALRLNDIDQAFDSAKTYKESYIRNLQQKVKTALNTPVIIYRNNVYRLDGNVTPVEREGLLMDYPRLSTGEEKCTIIDKSPRRKLKIVSAVCIAVLFGIASFITYLEQDKVIILEGVDENAPRPVDDMVVIPSGEFTMGSTDEEINRAYKWCMEDEGAFFCKSYLQIYQAEYPAQKIFLNDFSIDRKEISNAEFKMFLAAAGRLPSGDTDEQYAKVITAASILPVINVAFEDAQQYCAWLGKRLPTEAEWEKAARGTDARYWPWGSTWAPQKSNHGQGGDIEYSEDGSDGYPNLAPVGATEDISPYGVRNMSGNAVEWVDGYFGPYNGNDKYDSEFFNKNMHILRGGSYLYSKADSRVTARDVFDPADINDEDRMLDIGFRCVKDK